MVYSVNHRLRAVNSFKQGMAWSEVLEVFRISHSTLYRWLNLGRQAGTPKLPRGTFRPNEPYRSHRIDPKELMILVEKNPNWTLAEYATHFKCTQEAVRRRLKQQPDLREKRLVAKKEKRSKV